MMRLYCVLIFITAVFHKASSQSGSPGVKVQGRATDHSIKLRWAPDAPSLWQMANKYGYTIERTTLVVNGKVLAKPVKSILNSIPLKPEELSRWEKLIDEDDYVAVAAQAIFGATFNPTQNQSTDIVKIINKAREQESRYSFTLFAADQSIKAAQLSGLYYEDETIAPGTRYLYRIYANAPSHILKADTGFVYLGMQDYKPLPRPIDLKGEFNDHTVNLSWNGVLFDQIYNSFWVERSDDGRDFKKITKQPIINTFSGDQKKSKSIFRLDSLPLNDKKYYYRVKGNNAFGETGPPSDTVSGSGKPVFAYSPSITSHRLTKDGRVELQWSFPEKGESLLKSFNLAKEDPITKVKTEVRRDIKKTKRSVMDSLPSSSNYYVVVANDRYGRSTYSFPYLVQTEDSIPPVAPIGLTGRIDSLGHVSINWNTNAESDLSGYSIFRSNFASNEYVQVPGPMVKANSYTDTIKLNNLSEKIYYKIRANDNRFNASAFSQVLVLKKPDKIPPVPPVFASIKGDSTGIKLTWINSGSEDVMEHLLYRKENESAEWSLIKTFRMADSVSSYYDENVKHRTTYSYTLLAVDDDQLESKPVEPLTIKWIAANPYPGVEDIFYRIDKSKKSITLSWKYAHSGMDKFLIYKSSNGQPLRLFKTINATTLEIVDEIKSTEDNIEYRVVAGFENGDRTRVSKAVMVKW